MKPKGIALNGLGAPARLAWYAAACAVLAALAAPAWAGDDAVAPEHGAYAIKESEARVGTMLKSDIAYSALPPAASYADLSDKQQRMLKAAYDHMAADDEPPYPLHGIKTLLESTSALGQKLQAEGELKMLVQIDSHGAPLSVQVLKSPGEDVTRYAAMLLMVEKYKPALCHHAPCTQDFLWHVTFSRALAR